MCNKICEDIFTELIKKLNSENIRYFVLRNYKGLPEVNEAKDIDLVVEPAKAKYAQELLKKIFKNNGLEYYDDARFDKCYVCME